jgi:hypothetical protein
MNDEVRKHLQGFRRAIQKKGGFAMKPAFREEIWE